MAKGISTYVLRARSWRVKIAAALDLGGRGFRKAAVEIFVLEEASLVGELLEVVELEHKSLVKRAYLGSSGSQKRSHSGSSWISLPPWGGSVRKRRYVLKWWYQSCT